MPRKSKPVHEEPTFTFEEAMAMVSAGKYMAADYMAKGWFVWHARLGGMFIHNPYHGAGPSSRDHEFRASDADRHGVWRDVADGIG